MLTWGIWAGKSNGYMARHLWGAKWSRHWEYRRRIVQRNLERTNGERRRCHRLSTVEGVGQGYALGPSYCVAVDALILRLTAFDYEKGLKFYHSLNYGAQRHTFTSA